MPLVPSNRITPPRSSERTRGELLSAELFPVTGTGGIVAEWSSGGLVIRSAIPLPFWAKITGSTQGTNIYSAVQIDDGDTTGTFTAAYADGFGVQCGTALTDFPAYEINGRTGVPVGAKVQCWPAGDGTFCIFNYDGMGGGGPTSQDPVQTTTPTTNNDSSSLVAQYMVDPTTVADPTTIPVVQYTVANNLDGTHAGMLTAYYPSGTGSSPTAQFQSTTSATTTTFNYGGTTAGYTAQVSGGNTEIAASGTWDFSSATVTGISAGSFTWTVTGIKTTTYTAAIGELVRVDTTGGSFTVTLPTASGNSGKQIAVKRTTNSLNNLTVGTTGGQTIDGAGSVTMTSGTPMACVIFVSDGTNWMCLSGNSVG